jgi:hypothetical protein
MVMKGKITYPERTVVMDTATAIAVPWLTDADRRGNLFQALEAGGHHHVIGRTVRDSAIVPAAGDGKPPRYAFRIRPRDLHDRDP